MKNHSRDVTIGSLLQEMSIKDASPFKDVMPTLERPPDMYTSPPKSGVNSINMFMLDFFVQKCFAQLSSNYSLFLKFFGARVSAQKLLIKCW